MRALYLFIATILGSFLLLHSVHSGQHIQSIFCALLVFLAFLSRNDANSSYLVLMYLVVFAIGKIVVLPLHSSFFENSSGFIKNTYIFGFSALLDLCLVYLVRNRMALSLFITKGKKPAVLEKNYAEGPLLGLLIGYAAIDVFAFIENLVRNLEHLGINEIFAKQFWEITFFYNNYMYFKTVLLALSIAVLYMSVIIRKRQMPSAA